MVCNGFAMSLGDKLLEMSRIIFTAEILGLDDSQEKTSQVLPVHTWAGAICLQICR